MGLKGAKMFFLPILKQIKLLKHSNFTNMYFRWIDNYNCTEHILLKVISGLWDHIRITKGSKMKLKGAKNTKLAIMVNNVRKFAKKIQNVALLGNYFLTALKYYVFCLLNLNVLYHFSDYRIRLKSLIILLLKLGNKYKYYKLTTMGYRKCETFQVLCTTLFVCVTIYYKLLSISFHFSTLKFE